MPNSAEGRAADDSFNQAVASLQSFTYAQGGSDLTVPVDARQRTEAHLSRIAAQTGRFPSEEEENAVRKLYGVNDVPKRNS